MASPRQLRPSVLTGLSPKNLAPLVIGVSGHRDLHADMRRAAKDEVGAFLDRLAELMPHTPIRIMVGLGGRRRYARCGDGSRAQACWSKRYCRCRSRNTRRISATRRSRGCIVCSSTLTCRRSCSRCQTERAYLARNSEAEPDRVALYANLADTLARKTNLLIALWDGEFSALRAGTADTVVKYLAADTGVADRDARVVRHGVARHTVGTTNHLLGLRRARERGRAEPCTGPCYLSGIGENVLRRQPKCRAELRTQLMDLDRYNAEIRELQSQGAFTAADALAADLPAGIPGDGALALAAYRQRVSQSRRLGGALSTPFVALVQVVQLHGVRDGLVVPRLRQARRRERRS